MPSPSARPPSTAPSPRARVGWRASFRTYSRPAHRKEIKPQRHRGTEKNEWAAKRPKDMSIHRERVRSARFLCVSVPLWFYLNPYPSEHLQILVALPVRDVAAEAGELMALDGEEEPEEVRAQHAAEGLVGLEGGERLLEARGQLRVLGIVL